MKVKHARGLLYILLYDAKRMLDENKNSEEVKRYIDDYLNRNLRSNQYTRIQYD